MTDLPPDACCETCRWSRQRRDRSLGLVVTCHIRSVAGPFPQRFLDDFCGEWRAKPDAGPPEAMLKQPESYTTEDGGLWKPWPLSGDVFESFLKVAGRSGAEIPGIPGRVFAIRWPDGKIWDCINGWRADS